LRPRETASSHASNTPFIDVPYLQAVPAYILRVWLPDRPGALGAVASRVGAVGGDVVGIDILERGGGRAIDELVVDLPEESLVPLLLAEVRCVDGVDIEELRPVSPGRRDPDLLALEIAEILVAEDNPPELLANVTNDLLRLLDATWCVVVDLSTRGSLAFAGRPPPVPWLVAFVEGSQASVLKVGRAHHPTDIAWAMLASWGSALVVGRDGRPLHVRERRQLELLARIADRRLGEMDGRMPGLSSVS
jgi:hypothetical protein